MKVIALSGILTLALFLSFLSPVRAEIICVNDEQPPHYCYDTTEEAKHDAYADVVDEIDALRWGALRSRPSLNIFIETFFHDVHAVNEQHGNNYNVLNEMHVAQDELARAIIRAYLLRTDDFTDSYLIEKPANAINMRNWMKESMAELGAALMRLATLYDETSNGIARRQPIEGEVLGTSQSARQLNPRLRSGACLILFCE